MKPTIELWESVGLGLIVEMPSGVLYSNQTGGFSCLHPSAEGVFLPLGNDHSFWELISPGARPVGLFRGTEASRRRRCSWARRGRRRLHRRCLGPGPSCQFKLFRDLGLYPRNAILTWGNSD